MSDPHSQDASDPIVMTLRASPVRRWVAVGILTVLGVLLLRVGVAGASGIGWRLVVVAAGLGALFGAATIWRATGASLVLTRAGLREDRGRVVATLEEMTRVERGSFAFKPSNGFVVGLRAGGAGGWAPGLWWRVGRRVGVGGVTSAAEGRAMAEELNAMLAGRPPVTGR